LGYSAKSAKQLLEQKVQEDRYRAQMEKEKLAQEKKEKEKLDRKINQLAISIIETALSQKAYNHALERKVTADLALRAELSRRGFEFIRPAAMDDPLEEDYLPQAQKMLEAMIEIEKLAPETANQLEELARLDSRDFRVLTLRQWREIMAVIDGKFSKKFNKERLSFEDYKALCKKFKEINNLSIMESAEDEYDDLDGVSPSEIIREIVYELGVYELDGKKDIGVLFLRWKNPKKIDAIYGDDILVAEKLNWISSDESKEFIECVLDRIQDYASEGKNSIKLYLVDYGDGYCEVSHNNKSFISFPFNLNSLLDLFKKLGYQIKDKNLKEGGDEIRGSISIVWS